MFIINPDQYSLPCYRIGPFRTSDLSKNHTLPDSDLLDDYLDNRFGGRQYIYTYNGRKAINHALKHFNLLREDVVTILTTSGNFYISGCVTKEIEKFCKWSRTFEPSTKLIFVNHEFGYPFARIKDLKEYNLPIIEDCASSFFSNDPDNEIGDVGEFVIYSFPKMFPIQIGGLLVNNTKSILNPGELITRQELRYLKNVISFYINDSSEIINKRLANYDFLKEWFGSLGLSERFRSTEGSIPGVFMFKTNNHEIDLGELKKYFYAHGVQCSVFYGESSFFLPVHQGLDTNDLMYLYEVMNSFIQKSD